VTLRDRNLITVPLPPLDGEAAAWLLDLCCRLERAIWLEYGDQIEACWRATDPDQPIYGPPQQARRKR